MYVLRNNQQAKVRKIYILQATSAVFFRQRVKKQIRVGGWPSIDNCQNYWTMSHERQCHQSEHRGIRGTVEFMTDGHLALIKAVHSVGKHGKYKSNN